MKTKTLASPLRGETHRALGLGTHVFGTDRTPCDANIKQEVNTVNDGSVSCSSWWERCWAAAIWSCGGLALFLTIGGFYLEGDAEIGHSSGTIERSPWKSGELGVLSGIHKYCTPHLIMLEEEVLLKYSPLEGRGELLVIRLSDYVSWLDWIPSTNSKGHRRGSSVFKSFACSLAVRLTEDAAGEALQILLPAAPLAQFASCTLWIYGFAGNFAQSHSASSKAEGETTCSLGLYADRHLLNIRAAHTSWSSSPAEGKGPIQKQLGKEFCKKFLQKEGIFVKFCEEEAAPLTRFPLFSLIFVSSGVEYCSQRSWFLSLQKQSCFFWTIVCFPWRFWFESDCF